MRMIILALAVCLPASSVEAAFVSGTQLHRSCNGAAVEATQARCTAYISAIADAMEDGGSVDGFRACLPADADADHLRDQLDQHLDTNLLYRHHNASTIVARFLAETYPCS